MGPPYGAIGRLIHVFVPHNATGLYLAAAASSLLAVAVVYGRCWYTGNRTHLDDKWVFRAAAAAAPIPTYILLMIVPLDVDLAKCVLDDRVVVALAGLYGLVETLKDIRFMASRANRGKRTTKAPKPPKP